MTANLHEYADLYRRQGPWCLAYVDAGAGTASSREAAEVLPGDVRSALAGMGAPPADGEAMEGALVPAIGLPSPVSRFVLVREGTAEVNEVLPGALVGPEQVSVGLIPDLLPLLRHRPEEFPYIVAEVSREDAEIRLQYVGRSGIAAFQDLAGEREDIRKLPGGGWAHDKDQRRTEGVWRRNADQVAEEIDRLADSSGARMIVLSGDIRARGLVRDQLAEAHRGLVSMVDSHSHTAGSGSGGLEDQISQLVALQWAADQEQVLDRLALQEGQANPESATGIGSVLHALQQAQVEVLIMNDKALAERGLLALGAEPWVASAEEQALGAPVLGEAPASATLLRAAALTDASVLLVPDGVLPAGIEVAALLRWPVGPEAPGSTVL